MQERRVGIYEHCEGKETNPVFLRKIRGFFAKGQYFAIASNLNLHTRILPKLFFTNQRFKSINNRYFRQDVCHIDNFAIFRHKGSPTKKLQENMFNIVTILLVNE